MAADESPLLHSADESLYSLAAYAAAHADNYVERRLLRRMQPAAISLESTLLSPSSADALDIAPIHLLLEELCLNEFGFELHELKKSLSLQAAELQSSLRRFSEEVLSTFNPSQRLAVAMTFITDMRKINQDAAQQASGMLDKILLHSTFLNNLQREKDMLCKELADEQDKVSQLTAAMQIADDNARSRFEAEKAELREELQACQICLRNPRNVIILPCMHAQYCDGCVQAHQDSHTTCPTCRGTIRGKLPYIA